MSTVAVVGWDQGAFVVGRAAFGGVETVARSSFERVVDAVRVALERGDAGWPVAVEDVRVVQVEVRVQPTLPAFGGAQPVGAPYPWTFDVVIGAVSDGLEIAEVPLFDRTFFLQPGQDLAEVVGAVVRDASGGLAPDQLARRLARPRVQADLTRVRDRERARSTPPAMAAVSRVAERVGRREAPGPWERSREVEAVTAAILARRSVVVVGEHGTGRSAVLEAVAATPAMRSRLWRTTARRLISGARWFGEWQQQLDAVVDELAEAGGVLWVDDLGELARVGGTDAESSVAAYLLPALRRERVVLVGEATPAELAALTTRLGAFADRLTPVPLTPLSTTQLVSVIQRLADWIAERRKVEISRAAGRLAARLLARLVRAEEDPGRVVSFLMALSADARHRDVGVVGDEEVVQALVRRTGLAPILVDDRQVLRRDDLVAALTEKVRGQPEGIGAVADVISAFKGGLNDPDRPLGTLLLAGPTGVGKTATALALAEWAFGSGMSEPPLVRVDMSELQHPAQVHRLIGGDEPSEFIRRVREKPFCVVLLDEVEKAHPVFFDLLLGLLDEGRLTDAFGRVTDFRGAVILMTTNLGVRRGASLGFNGDGGGVDLSAIRQFFRPELLNRIDRVIPYRPLTPESVREIALRELSAIRTRPGLASRRLTLIFGDAVVARVVRAGFDPLLGARPLQRVVEQQVVSEIARYLLEHPVKDGAEMLVDEVDGAVVVVV